MDIVDQVKGKLRIEDIIQADGWPLTPRGRWRKCTRSGDGGLVVDTQNQLYHWYSYGEWGDVIQWIQYGGTHRAKNDFKAAVEEACRRANLPLPEWSQKEHTARIAARAREEALDVAHRVFMRWLLKSDEAMAYVASRGWSISQDEHGEEKRPTATAAGALLGYTGEGSAAEIEEMRREMQLGGVDLDGAAAIAILGYQGDLASWAARHDIEIKNDEWVKRGSIPGMIGHKRLVYPHIENGRLRYLSCRSIAEKTHYNLPEALAGKKRVYLNAEYATAAEVVVLCEGQADAISWGIWGYAAIGLCGVDWSDELAEIVKRHKTVYLAVDIDVTGVNSAWRIANQIGPTVRLVLARDPDTITFSPKADAAAKMIEITQQANNILRGINGASPRYPIPDKLTSFQRDGQVEENKDSNDLLRAFVQAGIGADEQNRLIKSLLDRAPMYVEAMTAWAGAREGAERDEAVKLAVAVIGRLDEFNLSQHKGRLAKILQVTLRDLERMIRAMSGIIEKAQRMGEPTYTWGGYVDGWQIEYLYDIDSHRAMLAWRDPDGVVDSGPGVNINGRYFEPSPPNDVLKSGGVIFPSALGDKKPIRELVSYLTMYLKSIYLLPSDKMGRLIAYWVITTWLYDAFETVIYLRAMGSAGAGKSELMRRIGLVCYRTMTANGAGSTSSLFRSLERYRGTVYIDEADLQQSDTESDMVKFYNLGAMRGNPIWRTVEMTGPDGEKTWEAVAFQTFCPKLVAMRKEFRDDAVGSRSLTIKLVSREMPELVAAGIPLTINAPMRARAQALRNLLVRWRLENWQPDIEVDAEFYDMTISPRLNQVAGPLLAIARDDPEQQAEIRMTLRDYYAESILSKSMTLSARVIEALWSIWNYPDKHKECVRVDEQGNNLIKIGDITKMTNEIMNMMNDEEEEDDDAQGQKKFKRTELKAQRVGRIVRDELQLQISERRRDGFFVYWNEPRMIGLATKFGIDPADFGPQPEKPRAIQPALAVGGNGDA